eukprot:9028959-Karenia_brevis.AAC.1
MLEQTLSLQHRWLGHVVRSSSSVTFASQALDWLNSTWWQMCKQAGMEDDPNNRTNWRHPTTSWAKCIEADVDNYYGLDW